MPLLAAFSSWFTLRLLSRQEQKEGMTVEPDLSEVRALQDSRDAIADTFLKLTRGGMTVADAARYLGLDISDLDEYERPNLRTAPQNQEAAAED